MENTNIEDLYLQLQIANTKIQNSNTAKAVKELRAQMQCIFVQIMSHMYQHVELVCSHKNFAGSGTDSSSTADGRRASETNILEKQLQIMVDQFEEIRYKMMRDCKKTVERRYFKITKEAASKTIIEKIITSKERESFLQKAIREHGRDKIQEMLLEISERLDIVKDINQLFFDMAALVEALGHQQSEMETQNQDTHLENDVMHANSLTGEETEQLQVHREYLESSLKWKCIGFFVRGGFAAAWTVVFAIILIMSHQRSVAVLRISSVLEISLLFEFHILLHQLLDIRCLSLDLLSHDG
ncbi:syntaxin-124-like [Castanea sativa]|uniref:syntaxin-124-like n=1 Tax=Castanea sativa TaxID=21020 RepID=UPI003F64D664